MMYRPASLLLLLATPASAQVFDRFALPSVTLPRAARPSYTLAPSNAVDLRFSPVFGARVGGRLADPRFDVPRLGPSVGEKLRVKSAGAMFDLYPFRSGFRISGGARVNGNDARNSSLAGAPGYAGAFTPEEAGAIHLGSIADDFAPVMTLGYAARVRRGLSVGIEAGALFQGHARAAAFNTTGSGAYPEGNFLTILERDRLNQADSFGNYAPTPMAQFNATLRF